MQHYNNNNNNKGRVVATGRCMSLRDENKYISVTLVFKSVSIVKRSRESE